jgi:diguanylate cyclase (GGDEF)-like protein
MQLLVYGSALAATFAMVFGYVLMCTHRFNYELNQQAVIDPLTNMYNRRGVENFLHREIEMVRRNQEPLALLIIDVNKFKTVNDQYGHAAGDQALIYIAETLKSNIRSGDLAGRLGGDEFVLVLTRTDYSTAKTIADRIKHHMDTNPFFYDNEKIQLSLSIGVGMLDIENPDYDSLYIQADNSLYEEKEEYHQSLMVI